MSRALAGDELLRFHRRLCEDIRLTELDRILATAIARVGRIPSTTAQTTFLIKGVRAYTAAGVEHSLARLRQLGYVAEFEAPTGSSGRRYRAA